MSSQSSSKYKSFKSSKDHYMSYDAREIKYFRRKLRHTSKSQDKALLMVETVIGMGGLDCESYSFNNTDFINHIVIAG